VSDNKVFETKIKIKTFDIKIKLETMLDSVCFWGLTETEGNLIPEVSKMISRTDLITITTLMTDVLKRAVAYAETSQRKD